MFQMSFRNSSKEPKSNLQCQNCKIHCFSDHHNLSQEKSKLIDENRQLKKEIENLHIHQGKIDPEEKNICNQKHLECELVKEIEALKFQNIKLQKMIELKLENSTIQKKINKIEVDSNELKLENSTIQAKMTRTENIISKMAQRIYKFAPIFFRTTIEKLIANQDFYNEKLSLTYLRDLKQFFSSFVHNETSNLICPDTEEMTDWLEATLYDHETLVKNFKFKDSKKELSIVLSKSALYEIIKLCRELN